MLRLDFSSLVIRPPFIRSRLTQLNQKPVTSVTYFFHRGRTDLRSSLNCLRWRLEVNSKLRTPKVFARRGRHPPRRAGFDQDGQAEQAFDIPRVESIRGQDLGVYTSANADAKLDWFNQSSWISYYAPSSVPSGSCDCILRLKRFDDSQKKVVRYN